MIELETPQHNSRSEATFRADSRWDVGRLEAEAINAAREICDGAVHVTTATGIGRARRVLGRCGALWKDVRGLVVSLGGWGDVLRLIGNEVITHDSICPFLLALVCCCAPSLLGLCAPSLRATRARGVCCAPSFLRESSTWALFCSASKSLDDKS